MNSYFQKYLYVFQRWVDNLVVVWEAEELQSANVHKEIQVELLVLHQQNGGQENNGG